MHLPSLAGVIVGLLLPLLSYAQIEHQHSAHSHGRSQVNLVLDGNVLELELIAPGMDVVGFEHPPRDRQQEQALNQALSTLTDSASWLALPAVSDCRITRSDAMAHGYDPHEQEANEHSEHDHPGDDHANAAPINAGDDHAEFRLSLKAECERAPAGLDLRLFEHFASLKEIRVDLITEQRQGRIALSAGQTRIDFAE